MENNNYSQGKSHLLKSNDWHWQVKNTVTDIATIEKLLSIKFSKEKYQQLEQTIEKFPMRITPYYLSLIDEKNYENDPIFKQSVPCISELSVGKYDRPDPLDEDKDSPAAGITHRYPDRVLFHVSNICGMYCRHCTRKRKVGDLDQIMTRDDLKEGIDYIKSTKEIRDVLLSGGDPFLLSDEMIDWILHEIRKISHVEVVRIGTRTPAVLPQRITKELVNVLKKYHPLWINTHFNHPREITESSSRALSMLADAGFPLGNQTVLLAGINDCPRIIKALCHKLVRNRVRPYYLFQCDLSEGLSHFRTSVSKGIEILENMIGHTSGFAVPSYVVDSPGGGGKIPIMPNYFISQAPQKVVLRNYEGMITSYHEPANYRTQICEDNCAKCQLELDLESANESKVIGIAQILADYDEVNVLIPENTTRLERRKEEYDQVIQIDKSMVQHGKNNDRVYLMDLDASNAVAMPEILNNIAAKENYGKIHIKVPQKFKDLFEKDGFVIEATVPKLYDGKETGYFMSKFLNEKRKVKFNASMVADVLRKASIKEKTQSTVNEGNEYSIRICKPEDAPDMATIYQDVFRTYPFPIDKPDYIKSTMDKNVTYFGAWFEGKLVALSSAEQYPEHRYVEMTDFATLPQHQGKGIASLLLEIMEKIMCERGFITAYTSARATSYGMNSVFSKMGYKFAGTLLNNTSISGHIEHMNIWYKVL